MTHDDRTMVTANTLIGTITVVDTATDVGVNVLGCDPGCHGVPFGAKAGSSGYYAYVSSKFSNTLPVVDADPNGDGNTEDAAVAGRVLLTASPCTATDDRITGNPGMGGQGVVAIPVVYNAWVQNLPAFGRDRLTPAQRDPTFAD